jgi:D-apionolactonase
MNQLIECYGTDQPLVIPEMIAYGAWQLELIAGDIRHIRYRGSEVIRSVGYILRDDNWGTCPMVLQQLNIERMDEGIQVVTINQCQISAQNRATLKRVLRITNDNIHVQAELQAEENFSTARCGFTVLYPLVGVVGSPVDVLHSNGETEQGRFPVNIEPWQPFKTIQRLVYQHGDGIEVATDYQGDIFEMEDQRAWMDASYKVYSRPLEYPWPYIVDASQPQRQSIRLTARRATTPVMSAADVSATAEMTMPVTGILITAKMLQDVDALVGLLREMNPGYVLFHCHPALEGYQPLAALSGVLRQLAGIALHLEYVLPVARHDDFRRHFAELATVSETHRISPACIIISPATDLKSTPPGSEWPWCPALDDIFSAARAIFRDVKLGGGMISYFTELNRKRPPLELIDFVTHATCPIVHDAADRAVMQTLESLPYITQSTRGIIGSRLPYHLGPAMISMRDNPYGAAVYPNPDNIRVTMTNSDPRQKGRFFASWLVGYVAQLSGADISHWCPAGMLGDIGLGQINASGFSAYPAWQVVKFLASQAGSHVRVLSNDNPNVVVLTFSGQQTAWLVASLSPAHQKWVLECGSVQLLFGLGGEVRQRQEQADIDLAAFGVVCCHSEQPVIRIDSFNGDSFHAR